MRSVLSQRGADFAAVLEETIRVAEPEAPDILAPRKGWTTAGCFMGDGWSVAWRVLDAQYWGVPQRRRRIALVADFGGGCAPEILFKPKSSTGHFEPSRTPEQATAGDAAESSLVYCLQGNGIDRADTAGCNGRGWTDGSCYTLNTIDRPAVVFENHRQDCRFGDVGDVAPSCVAKYGTGGNNTPIVVNEIAPTLDASYYKGTGSRNGEERTIVGFDRQAISVYGENDIGSTCTAHLAVEAADLVCAVDVRNGSESPELNGTLQAKETGYNLNSNNVVRQRYIVRRLTPTECARLQGFPDHWCDIGEWVDSKGKKHKDSDAPKYKALGNSIAIPPWLWVCSQFGEYIGSDKTMASLFSGIDGFPLIWSFLYGKENCVWASEIEEYCIALSKIRFPE